MPTKKMDKKLVAQRQRHEVSYISKKFGIRASVVKAAIKAVGRSRAKIYAELRSIGHTIKTRKYK